jgi:hypothetical protein
LVFQACSCLKQAAILRGASAAAYDRLVAEIGHVTAVEVVGNHRLRLAFEDGAEGELDLSRWR